MEGGKTLKSRSCSPDARGPFSEASLDGYEVLRKQLRFHCICLLAGSKWNNYFKVEEKYIQYI